MNINQKTGIHLGIIPDGHRRYARTKNISNLQSYQEGFKLLKTFLFELMPDISSSKKEKNIFELSVYVCSIDNLTKRSPEDVKCIQKMIENFIKFYTNPENKIRIFNHRIKITIIGNLEHETLREYRNSLLDIVFQTNFNDYQYRLNLAIGYDGREEIRNAFATHGESRPLKGKENFQLESDIDLVIRTGGEKRTSGFFPWHTIYSEWFFLDKYWCELEKKDLVNIIDEYYERHRRFGK